MRQRWYVRLAGLTCSPSWITPLSVLFVAFWLKLLTVEIRPAVKLFTAQKLSSIDEVVPLIVHWRQSKTPDTQLSQ